MKYQPILIIFDIRHPEETCHWKIMNLTTPATNSWCAVLQSVKMILNKIQHFD